MSTANVRVGIGGWTFPPWRGTFYPVGLPQSKELHYTSHRLTAIEVNGTFYSLFKPPTFAKWRDETPEGFVFSLKAHQLTTHRRVLAGAGDAIARFVDSGITELQDKLGPIVWQFLPGKAFEPADFEAFLALLPASIDGRHLRHALDVRHASFATPEFLALAHRYHCVPVYTDSEKHPAIADPEADFAYLRLMRSHADIPTGYAPEALAQWAQGVRTWTSGTRPRDVYVFFINGAKERAPAAAMALLEQLV